MSNDIVLAEKLQINSKSFQISVLILILLYYLTGKEDLTGLVNLKRIIVDKIDFHAFSAIMFL